PRLANPRWGGGVPVPADPARDWWLKMPAHRVLLMARGVGPAAPAEEHVPKACPCSMGQDPQVAPVSVRGPSHPPRDHLVKACDRRGGETIWWPIKAMRGHVEEACSTALVDGVIVAWPARGIAPPRVPTVPCPASRLHSSPTVLSLLQHAIQKLEQCLRRLVIR